MTEIEFHICDSADVDSQKYLIQRTLAAYRAQSPVHIHCDDLAQAQHMSEALWSHSQSCFLANEVLTEPQKPSSQLSPITLSDNISFAAHFGTLLYCGKSEPEHISRFLKYCFIVPADDETKTLARERYKFFKQRGYPLQHIPVTKTLF